MVVGGAASTPSTPMTRWASQIGRWLPFESEPDVASTIGSVGSRDSADDTETQAVGEPPAALADRDLPTTELMGERYAILDLVGSGGMGTVYRAYDSRLRREVALKRLRRGRDEPVAQARMIREAQAMARLSHPNVVPVFDVDVAEDSVLIAMEFVAGTTLRRWLKKGRSTSAIIAAFVRAGRGLAAAHAADLVHRDFKPANVLVGDDEQIKVTDFGLAKSTSTLMVSAQARSRGSGDAHEVSGEDSVTNDDTVLGTPRYMAPEQHVGDAIGPAADQFAFCVALWEALVGKPPFAAAKGRSLLTAKMEGPSGTLPVSVPRRVGHALRRGMQPRAEDRWPDMSSLLDVLEDDGGRRRLVIVGGLAVGTVVVAATWSEASTEEAPCHAGAQRIDEVWGLAQRDAAQASVTAVTGFGSESWPAIAGRLDAYAEGWAKQYDDACAATHVRREQSNEALDLRMQCLESARRELAFTIDLLGVADSDITRRGVDAIAGLPGLQRCEDVDALQREVAPPEDPQVAAAVDAIALEMTEVRAEEAFGRDAQALELVDELLARAREQDYEPLILRLQAHRGMLLANLGRADDGIVVLEEALPRTIELGMWPTTIQISLQLARLMTEIDVRLDEAEWLARTALAHVRRIDPESEWEGKAHEQVAGIALARGELEAAESGYTHALELYRARSQDDPGIASGLRRLASVQGKMGRYDEAKRNLAEAIELSGRVLGAKHPLVASLLMTNAIMHGRSHDYVGAAELFERALAVQKAVDGGESEDTARIRINLATAQSNLEQYEQALRNLELAQGPIEAALGAEHHRVAEVLQARAMVYVRMGKHAEAIPLLEQTIRIFEETFGTKHPALGTFQYNYADCLRRSKRLGDAKLALERSLEIRRAVKTPPEIIGDTARLLARVRIELGEDADESRTLLEDAIALYGESEIDTQSSIAEARELLTRLEGPQMGRPSRSSGRGSPRGRRP